MRSARMYSAKVESWDVLVSSLQAKLAEMPFLQPFFNELMELIAAIRAVVVEQEAARASFHDAVGKRVELERKGVELRSRIAAFLKAQYGFRNEQLRQFGLNPLPRVTRNSGDTQIPTPEAPAPLE
jgi:hypothetical protein